MTVGATVGGAQAGPVVTRMLSVKGFGSMFPAMSTAVAVIECGPLPELAETVVWIAQAITGMLSRPQAKIARL